MLLDLRSLWEGTAAPAPAVVAGGGGYDDEWLRKQVGQANLAALFRQQQAAFGLYAAGRINRATLLRLLRDLRQ